jgi:biopolymer transport protein ExbB/TolQ
MWENLVKARRFFVANSGESSDTSGLPFAGRTLLAFVAMSMGLILILTLVLKYDGLGATFLLDNQSNSIFPYPFTIQNIMHMVFFFGMGELYIRWHTANRELGFVRKGYLPENEHTVLQAQDLGPIRRAVADDFDDQHGFLPYLINLVVLQFQSSRSVDQAVSVLNTCLDLIEHRIDLRYQSLRYVIWVIPTIGFIGTVVGISSALGYVNPDHMDLRAVTANLGVAFYTTIVALVQSAVLVLLQHIVQQREESALNLAGNYCLKNLINRLYVAV